MRRRIWLGAVLLAAAAVLASPPPASAGGCYGGSSFGFSVGFSSRGHSHYGFRYGYRSHGHFGRHYGYRHCGPRYVHRPYRYRSCAPTYRYRGWGTTYIGPGYARVAPSVTYVYVDPPTSVRTVTSDSAYHDWQASVRAPVYETVPRVVREESASAAEAAVEGRAIAPGIREVEPSEDWADGRVWDDEAGAEADEPRVEVVEPWRLLERGDYGSARDAFGVVAEARRDDARPRIGYAIASAALGDEAAAAAALRRALVVEPEGFALPTASEDLLPVVERVSRTLRAMGGEGSTDHDRWLVIAALDYLRGEFATAREAIKLSRSFGETHLGAKNLWRLLGLSDKPLEKVRVGE